MKMTMLVLCGCVGLGACGSLYEGGRAPGERVMETGAPPEAETILFVEEVLGLGEDLRGRQAIVIRDGRIVDVTTRSGALQYRGVDTVLRSYPGARALPGLVDAHAHIAGLGKALDTVDLRGARSYGEVLRRCRDAAAQLPEGVWLEGRGWDQNLWPDARLPVHDDLSQLFPERPVWLRRVDGHAALANAAAMQRSGIRKETRAPEGGRILRKPNGEPTGVFVDLAMELISRQLPREDGRLLERRLLLAHDELVRLGFTRIHDAGVSPTMWRILKKLESEGRWKLGVYGMWTAPGKGRDPRAPEDPGKRARLRMAAVKLYADGALGSRGAALLEPYSDEPDHDGLLTIDEAELERLIRRCAELGLQPCVHAIGDRANRLVLDVYERALSAEQRRELRPRIEHAQVLSAEDLPRFAQLGVLASMQPTHLTSDMPWAPQRLGAERVRYAYAFRDLIESGAHISFGSDFPVEPAAPFDGFFAAMTTIPPARPSAEPLRSDQRVSATEALRGFTSEAAYAAGEEEVRGRIAKGFEADLTIVDRNVLKVGAGAVLGTRVLATFIHGERVFGVRSEEEGEGKNGERKEPPQ
jgi:predicted amidohydrolase YtcJ